MGAAPRTAVAAARWEHFAHDADVGIRGVGPTVESAFEQAAIALKAAMTDAEVRPETRVDVVCSAPDIELLFTEWINAIIYEMAVRRMIFGRFAVRIDGNKLSGSLWGEAIDRERHAAAAEPKGATFTALQVKRLADGSWTASCVVDV